MLLKSSQAHLQRPDSSPQHSSLRQFLPEASGSISINPTPNGSIPWLCPPNGPLPTGQVGSPLVLSPLQPLQPDSPLSLNLSCAEADDLLHVFQTQMTEYFPFVIVPAGTRTQDLRDDKPFLFATIMLAASRKKLSLEEMTGSRLMEYLGVRMLLNGEKSLDLLQGLLVYLAWYVS